ncbi:hypothetical protein [Burkholderia ubonensis]|nr:hypothetical protein [Burkholderia ubonensis]
MRNDESAAARQVGRMAREPSGVKDARRQGKLPRAGTASCR